MFNVQGACSTFHVQGEDMTEKRRIFDRREPNLEPQNTEF